MVIYLYGPDSYGRGEKVRELVTKYRAKYAHADFLDADLGESPGDWALVRDFLKQSSLFASSKLCLIRESGAVSEKNEISKEEVKEWKKVLASAAESEKTFVIISDSSKSVAAFGFLLRPPIRSQEFSRLSGRRLQDFVLREAARQKIVFETRALVGFLSYVSGSEEPSWSAIAELERASLARFPQPISIASLGKIISLGGYDESYQIAYALIRANKGIERLEMLETLALKGDEPRYTLNLLGSLARGEDAVLLARVDEMVKGGESEDEVALTGFALRGGG
ncbi:MAG: hypothetical protein Q8R20_02030 [Nanoarchaeota archaeon]|nr:hypothetical protein [Nanoarchaeota archaeon]